MRRAALLLVIAASAYAAGAKQRDIFPWHLSGDAFVAQQVGDPGIPKWEQGQGAAAKRRYAEGYQAGVVDATQGKSWCAPDRMKPAEVDDRIWDELLKRRGSMPENAASVLVELYAARFPCSRR